MMKTAGKWLAEMRDKYLATSIVYITSEGKQYRIKATVGASKYVVPNEYGVLMETVYQDFIVSELHLKHKPAIGDTILWRGALFEVLAPERHAAWYWCDNFHSSKRIHTKFYKVQEGSTGGESDGTDEGTSGSGGSSTGSTGSESTDNGNPPGCGYTGCCHHHHCHCCTYHHGG